MEDTPHSSRTYRKKQRHTMKMTINNTKGFWEVNGKRAKDWNVNEQRFMNDFIKKVKPKSGVPLEMEVEQ